VEVFGREFAGGLREGIQQEGEASLIPTLRFRRSSQPAGSFGSGGFAFFFESLETLFLIAVVVCGFFTVARTLVRIQSQFQLDYAEGSILGSSWRVAQGGSLYQPLRGVPYQIDPYPPFIYKLVSLVITHTGLSFVYPRFLALTAAVVACLLAAILIHCWTRRWKLALAFGLLPLTVAVVQGWLGILRYDLIGIALTMAGLIVFVVFPRHRFWSLPLFVLAVGGLYTLVSAPAACCIYLWLEGQKKKGVLFGACLAGALLAGLLYGQHASAGWMVHHLFKTQHSPYSISQLASLVQGLLRGYALLLLLSAVVIWKSIREKQLSLLAIYWCLVVGASLSLGKVGAAGNHMLHLVFAACISAAVAYDWMRRNSSGDWGLVLALSTLILVTIANTPFRPKKPIDELGECGQAYAAIRGNLGDRILADNIGALVLAGKSVYVTDPFAYRWLVTYAGLPDTDLRRMITYREFTSIVIDRGVEDKETDLDRWPEDVRRAIRANYQLKRTFICNDARFVYEPKDAPRTTQDEVQTKQSAPHTVNRIDGRSPSLALKVGG
jgi:hypothetical protein